MTRIMPDRRDEILREAADLFRRRGYSATTMSQIADEIGILKGSLYHHYRSKEEILFAMSRDPLKLLVDRVGAIQRSKRPVEEKIAEAVRTHVRAFADSYPHLMVITAEREDSLPDGMRAEIVALRREYQATWQRLLQQGVRAGAIRADLEVSIMVNMLLGGINWMHRWFDPSGAIGPERMATMITDLFLAGASASAEGPPGGIDGSRPDGRK